MSPHIPDSQDKMQPKSESTERDNYVIVRAVAWRSVILNWMEISYKDCMGAE